MVFMDWLYFNAKVTQYLKLPTADPVMQNYSSECLKPKRFKVSVFRHVHKIAN
jgi:hypothetical protein